MKTCFAQKSALPSWLFLGCCRCSLYTQAGRKDGQKRGGAVFLINPCGKKVPKNRQTDRQTRSLSLARIGFRVFGFCFTHKHANTHTQTHCVAKFSRTTGFSAGRCGDVLFELGSSLEGLVGRSILAKHFPPLFTSALATNPPDTDWDDSCTLFLLSLSSNLAAACALWPRAATIPPEFWFFGRGHQRRKKHLPIPDPTRDAHFRFDTRFAHQQTAPESDANSDR